MDTTVILAQLRERRSETILRSKLSGNAVLRKCTSMGESELKIVSEPLWWHFLQIGIFRHTLYREGLLTQIAIKAPANKTKP